MRMHGGNEEQIVNYVKRNTRARFGMVNISANLLVEMIFPCDREIDIARYLAIEKSMATNSKQAAPKSIRPRSDGRKTFLVYMDASLIKEVKKVALEDEVTAYEIVEAATREWMDRRARKQKRSS